MTCGFLKMEMVKSQVLMALGCLQERKNMYMREWFSKQDSVFSRLSTVDYFKIMELKEYSPKLFL
jgi:hypothetical protein